MRAPARRWMPERYMCVLKYHRAVINTPITPPGTTSQTWVVRGNSPFEVDYSSSLGQPTGWDEIIPLYRYCRVHYSKIRWTFINETDVHAQVSITASRAFNQGVEDPFETPGFVKAIIPGTRSGARYNQKTFTLHGSTKRVWNVSEITSSTNWACSAVANPVNPWYFRAFYVPLKEVSCNFSHHYTIYYSCEFFNQWEPHPSTTFTEDPTDFPQDPDHFD